ncbi:MAG TPA: hypothetical protein DD426_10840 [Clostridiaceae bacterium]|nr:hypothetical protein [Clostridiaceae bacterium]
MALQMGGESPHFGMVLTEGSLEAYSIKRDLAKGSNDRGCFILHPSSMELEPGETKEINWMIFPHEGKDDFQKQLGNFCKYIKVEAERYVLFPGERNRICITPSFAARSVLVNGNQLSAAKNGQYQMEYTAKTCGEEVFSICVDGVHTWCRTFVQEEVGKLAENRCWFIVNHQQYEGRCPELRGAYLTYDNEEKHIFYNRTNDYNGGRERVGMGLLMAEFLL